MASPGEEKVPAETGDAPEEEEVKVVLKQLPDAIESMVYVKERWPLVLDSHDGNATRFLKYQAGNFLSAINPKHMVPENLRAALVGSLRYGHNLTIDLGKTDLEIDQFFDEKCFPATILSKPPVYVNTPEFWKPLLRPDAGDPRPEEFEPRDGFRLVVISSKEEAPPLTLASMAVIKIIETKKTNSNSSSDEVAVACGVKMVKRNQKKMCEAAFEGDLDEVKSWLEKGYDLESKDAHDHTSLSEAAAKGHIEVVEYLLDQGADPNACNDTGRSPMFRAAFHGHVEMVELLLQAGGDPRLRSQEETPKSVSKNDDVKAAIDAWDIEVTDRLIEERKKEIARRMEERITTAVEREALARDKIRQELVDMAKVGDVKVFRERMDELTMEALQNNERPRGTAMCRDEKGNSLLMIAVTKGHEEFVRLLLSHWKTLDEEFDKDERKIWYVSVNARDNKGWNATCIATFHMHRAILEMLLEAGGDPTARNVYGKNAFWFGQDELDAAEHVMKDRSAMRDVLNNWESQRLKRLLDAGASEEEVQAMKNEAVAKVVEKQVDAEKTQPKGEDANTKSLDVSAMNAKQLRSELKKLKLETKGNKATLAKRLTDALKKNAPKKKGTKSGNSESEKLKPQQMSVKELRAELSRRKLDTKGAKSALVRRLEEALKGGKKKRGGAASLKKKTPAGSGANAVKAKSKKYLKKG